LINADINVIDKINVQPLINEDTITRNVTYELLIKIEASILDIFLGASPILL